MVKKRNPVVVLLLSLLTCFVYMLYWVFSTSRELNKKGALDMSAGLMLVLCFIPIVSLFAIWKHCSAVETLSEGNTSGVLLFVLWIVFFPIALFMAQSELNKHAEEAPA